MNEVKLRGTIDGNSHLMNSQEYGEVYRSFITTKRKSGAHDRIPFISEQSYRAGDQIALEGHLASEFVREDDHFHLDIYAVCDHASSSLERGRTNSVVMTGLVKKKKPVRLTPSGRSIIDFSFSPMHGDKPYGFFPCIAWGELADEISCMDTADIVYWLRANFQSRKYEKNGKIKTAYELCVSSLDPA